MAPPSDEERSEERTDALSDAQLVAAARAGDPDAFAVLMGRYRLLALSLALRLVPDGQEPGKVWMAQVALEEL